MVFADIEPAALAFARANAELHGLQGWKTRVLDFTTDRLAQTFDLILAADVAYQSEHYAALASFLAAHVRPTGTILLTESLQTGARAVVDRLESLGFAHQRRAVWVVEEGRKERTWLHVLARKTGA